MKLKNATIAGLLATLAAVVLLWLMDVNLIGWLGVWLAPGAPWIVGLLLTLVIGLGFGALWSGTFATHKSVRKLPGPLGGVMFGAGVAVVMIFLVPLILSLFAGDPGVLGVGGDGGSFLGARIVPGLPDLGFDPPLAFLAESDWWSRDDYAGRLLPFGLAFMLYGLVLALTDNRSKS